MMWGSASGTGPTIVAACPTCGRSCDCCIEFVTVADSRFTIAPLLKAAEHERRLPPHPKVQRQPRSIRETLRGRR